MNESPWVTRPVSSVTGTRGADCSRVTSSICVEIPHAELRELPDCGHTAMFDAPELVATEILQFTSASI